MLIPIHSPIESDPYWNNVVLLMHMDGVNGGTTFTEQTGLSVTVGGNTNTSSTQYKFGGTSAYFDGTGDYLRIPYSSNFDFSSGDWTIEGWFYATSLTGNNTIYSGWASPNNGVRVELAGSNLTLYINAAVVLSTAVSANTMYSFAAVQSSGTVYLFLNGVGTSTTTPTISVPSTSYVWVGSLDGTNYIFDGYIDELRITKGVARYTANYTPRTTAFPDQ